MAISITARVRNAMVGLTLMLCLLFTGLIFLLVYIIEDQVFVNQMKIEQNAFERVIATGEAQRIRDWQPANANIKRVSSAASLPASLPKSVVLSIAERSGIHEYFDGDNAMFIARLAQPNNGKSYYLVYNVKNLLAVRDTKSTLFVLIAALTLIITVVSVLLARRLTKSTLAPVSSLTNALQNEDLDHVVIELANEFSEDEIGTLTRELAQALERVGALAQREYEFNRGVSHELRSPIQVAQSATELLQIYAGKSDTQISKPIARLQRSVAEMNEIAEAFLWLASDRVVEPDERCSVAALKDMLTAVQSSFRSHEIIVNVADSASFYYPLPSTVLSVVLRSLVRNAVTHGDLSAIIVDLHSDHITVSNSVDLTSHQRKGFGIGMSIVERICDRFDCELSTCIENGNRYRSSIVFV